MKQCQTIQEQFDDRLDNRLSPQDIAIVDAHIASCESCRREWAASAGLWDLIGKQPAIEPSFGFAQRTLRRLSEAPPSPWRWPVLRWATAASLAMLVAVGGVFVHRQREQTVQRVAAYQAIEQDRLADFDVIVCLDQLGGKNHL
jgi:predicted anti-sigma-YlaC factor YlaD